MRYKKFKNAEIEVSQLAVGTWAIGGQNYGKVDKNEAICAIRRMIENGVNLIDTAPCYGNGTSEKIVGEVLKEIPREQVLISTKFGLIPDIYTHGSVGADPEGLSLYANGISANVTGTESVADGTETCPAAS